MFFVFSLSAMVGGATQLFFYVYLPSMVCCIAGFAIMKKQNVGRLSLYLLGFFIGIILPIVIGTSYSHIQEQNQISKCKEDPRALYCNWTISKAEKDQWYVNNCEKIERNGYFLYRCNDNDHTSEMVPDEFTAKWSKDNREEGEVLDSFGDASSNIKACFQVNSPINTVTPSGRICAGIYGEWPNYPLEWKLVSSQFSIERKTYNFEFKKYDRSIVCDHTSQYCRGNWY